MATRERAAEASRSNGGYGFSANSASQCPRSQPPWHAIGQVHANLPGSALPEPARSCPPETPLLDHLSGPTPPARQLSIQCTASSFYFYFAFALCAVSTPAMLRQVHRKLGSKRDNLADLAVVWPVFGLAVLVAVRLAAAAFGRALSVTAVAKPREWRRRGRVTIIQHLRAPD